MQENYKYKEETFLHGLTPIINFNLIDIFFSQLSRIHLGGPCCQHLSKRYY